MAESLSNPLYDIHRQADAEFQAYADLPIVSTFGEPQAEYAALHKSAGLMDEPQRGFLELTGRDRHAFLNNLITNETWSKTGKKGLAAGSGVYAFFLNTKGRIVADMNVLELGEKTLLEMDARQVPAVREAFEKYKFAEQVTLTSRIGALHQIGVFGPGASAVGADPFQISDFKFQTALESRAVRVFGVEAVAWADNPTGSLGFHLVFDAAAARTVWMNLLSRFGESNQIGKRALRPIGWAAFNAVRIEAGRPLFGIDFDATVLPGETTLLSRAVSFTKGCYLGQEIVARMHARGQAARQMIGIRMDDESLPIAGAHVYSADESEQQIGGITSSTISPILSNAAVCLGYVKRAHAAVGTAVRLPAEGAMRTGKIVELPFVQGDQAKEQTE
jgi:aminomethyltransferase